jgi:hypothetical protein
MDAERALTIGLGLKPGHWKVLVRTGWVLFVTFHIARAAGWLAAFGFMSPYANAADVEKLLRAAEVNARISMQTELRVQIRAWCSTNDGEIRALAWNRIDELRHDLREIAKLDTPEPTCAAPAATHQ